MLTAAPWSVSALVRQGGEPSVTDGLLPGRAGSELPTMLRLRVGPITLETCDGAAYTMMLAAWRGKLMQVVAVGSGVPGGSGRKSSPQVRPSGPSRRPGPERARTQAGKHGFESCSTMA